MHSTDKVNVELELPVIVFPNPLVSNTALGFNLDKNENIKAELYDVSGQLVKEIFSGVLPEGYNELYFESSLLAHGTYYVFIKDENGKKKFSAKLLK